MDCRKHETYRASVRESPAAVKLGHGGRRAAAAGGACAVGALRESCSRTFDATARCMPLNTPNGPFETPPTNRCDAVEFGLRRSQRDGVITVGLSGRAIGKLAADHDQSDVLSLRHKPAPCNTPAQIARSSASTRCDSLPPQPQRSPSGQRRASMLSACTLPCQPSMACDARSKSISICSLSRLVKASATDGGHGRQSGGLTPVGAASCPQLLLEKWLHERQRRIDRHMSGLSPAARTVLLQAI